MDLNILGQDCVILFADANIYQVRRPSIAQYTQQGEIVNLDVQILALSIDNRRNYALAS
jgi:hypothetical protein